MALSLSLPERALAAWRTHVNEVWDEGLIFAEVFNDLAARDALSLRMAKLTRAGQAAWAALIDPLDDLYLARTTPVEQPLRSAPGHQQHARGWWWYRIGNPVDRLLREDLQ